MARACRAYAPAASASLTARASDEDQFAQRPARGLSCKVPFVRSSDLDLTRGETPTLLEMARSPASALPAWPSVLHRCASSRRCRNCGRTGARRPGGRRAPRGVSTLVGRRGHAGCRRPGSRRCCSPSHLRRWAQASFLNAGAVRRSCTCRGTCCRRSAPTRHRQRRDHRDHPRTPARRSFRSTARWARDAVRCWSSSISAASAPRACASAFTRKRKCPGRTLGSG
jgi:hypothetical protein